MTRSLDTLNFYLGRLGMVGAVGVLLIAASLVYKIVVLHARETTLDEQVLRNEQAQREAAAHRARAAQVARIEDGKPAMAPAAAALRRLFDAAEEAGLELDRGEYRLTEVKDAHLLRYQLSLPVYGSYPEIRAFVALALNTDPALALSTMLLRRDSIETPDLSAQLNFIIYLEAGA